ncbi:TPA: hypothetical protein ACGXM3_005216 [Bacillus cereus]
MKIEKYNMGDNGDVFVTMENNDTLALKWLPFKGDMTMVEIDMFKGEDSVFDSSYRAFLTKSCSLNNGEFVYNLYASIDDAKGEKDLGSHIMLITEKQYYRPQKETSLRKLVQCFYKIMKGENNNEK